MGLVFSLLFDSLKCRRNFGLALGVHVSFRLLRDAVAVLCLHLSLIGICAAETGPVAPPLTINPDPDVRYGVLPNGMRFALTHNATPADQMSFRLMFNMGSFEEDDDQRGAAHFVEHMAFRSNSAFPGAMAESVFAPLGVAFGRDLNAFTGFESTIFKLDIPNITTNPKTIRTGLNWLRGVADGVRFSPADVDAERRVILAEKEARNSDQMLMAEEIAEFQAPDARSTKRSPLGTPVSLQAMTGATLQRFYDDWYRPENAVLVVAGDRPVDEMERQVRAAFESWTARGAGHTRAARSFAPKQPESTVFIRKSDKTATAVMSACMVMPTEKRPSDQLTRLRQTYLDQIWLDVLNARLIKLINKPEHKLLGATAMSPPGSPDVRGTCLIVMPIEEQWEPALLAARQEWARFLADGATDEQFDESIERVRSRFRGAALQAKTRASPEIADAIAMAWLNELDYLSPAQAFRAFDLATDGLTPADIKARLKTSWPGQQPLIAVAMKSPPTAQAVLSAWNTKRSTDNQKPAAAVVDWPYWSFGKTGKIASRQVFGDPDFTRLTFKNGTVLNFRHTAFAQNSVEVRVAFGAGRRSMKASDVFASQLAGPLLTLGGLGKIGVEDIQNQLDTSATSFQVEVGTEVFFFKSTPFASQLPTQMMVMAAYMTDPGFRPQIDARLPTAVRMMERLLTAQPAMAAQIALERAIFTPDRWSMPPVEKMQTITSKEFERILRPSLVTSPVEITIVGDIDEKAAIDAVASNFGAWAPRKFSVPTAADPQFKSFPQGSLPPITTSHQGPRDKAVTMMTIPLYVATPVRRREEYALKLLADIIEVALRKRLRSEMGSSYAPVVGTAMPDGADQGQMVIMAETGPNDVVRTEAETRLVLAQIASGAIEDSMVEAVRQPFLTQINTTMASNGFWASVLSVSSRNAQGIEDARQIKAMVAGLTLQDIKTAAATWLAKPLFVVRALPEAAETVGATK